MAASYPGTIKSFSTKAPGQAIASSHINELQDEVVAIETQLGTNAGTWKTYTPTWTATTTNPTIGNGQLYGHYFLIGKMCTAYVYLRFGTTTTPGDGYWEISLPFMSGLVSGYINGNGYVSDDVSSPKYMTIHPTITQSANIISRWMWLIPVKNTNYLNSTVPFTWSAANNSRLQFNITYPIV